VLGTLRSEHIVGRGAVDVCRETAKAARRALARRDSSWLATATLAEGAYIHDVNMCKFVVEQTVSMRCTSVTYSFVLG
jgi:hypothetical protein